MNSYKQALFTGIIRITANIIMIGAVFLGMYQASRWHFWPSEAIFCLYFFGISILAWVGAFMLTRWVRKTWPAQSQTLVDLPGRGCQLVEWRVVPRRPYCVSRQAIPAAHENCRLCPQ